MVICRWCKRIVVDTGNPAIIHSNCSDCNESHGKYREERLNGSISKVSNKRRKQKTKD